MATLALPVTIQSMTIQRAGITIYYPRVINLRNITAEQTINQAIYRSVHSLMEQQSVQQGTHSFAEVIGFYEIKTNERNILSLSLSNYAYASQHAHGLTLLKSLTFDIQTGRQYRLKDLFLPESDYVGVLSEIVQKQITERDIPLLDRFSTISPDQDFYIADKALVLYFQLYEITPYYVGMPMFPISVYALQSIIDENGPLGRMAAN